MNPIPKYDKTHFGIRILISKTNLVELHYPEEIEVDLHLAKLIEEIISDIQKGEDFYLLTNFENSFGKVTKEAQFFFAKEAPSINQVKASAIVLNNLALRMTVKFYIRIVKPQYISKIFSTIKDAKDWLYEIGLKNEI